MTPDGLVSVAAAVAPTGKPVQVADLTPEQRKQYTAFMQQKKLRLLRQQQTQQVLSLPASRPLQLLVTTGRDGSGRTARMSAMAGTHPTCAVILIDHPRWSPNPRHES